MGGPAASWLPNAGLTVMQPHPALPRASHARLRHLEASLRDHSCAEPRRCRLLRVYQLEVGVG